MVCLWLEPARQRREHYIAIQSSITGVSAHLQAAALWGGRVRREIALGNLPPKAAHVLDAVLYRGELPHGELETIVGTGERQARRVAAALIDLSVLTSDSSRAPLHIAFPAMLASRWMPGLAPIAFPGRSGFVRFVAVFSHLAMALSPSLSG